LPTVHQLAAACKKYKGIVFTNKNGNIINDDNEEADNTLEITGVDVTEDETNNNDTENETNNNDTLETLEIKGVHNNTTETTGVHNDTSETETIDMYTYANNQLDNTDNNQDENQERYNDEVSIEDESPEDIHIAINDINTVHEMNTGQLNINPDTGEEMEAEIETNTHRYNLRPRPTKRNQKYSMVNVGRQSTIAKPHLHVMLNQAG